MSVAFCLNLERTIVSPADGVDSGGLRSPNFLLWLPIDHTSSCPAPDVACLLKKSKKRFLESGD